MSLYKRSCICISVLWPESSDCSNLLKRYEDVYLQINLFKSFFFFFNGNFIHGLPKLKTAQEFSRRVGKPRRI